MNSFGLQVNQMTQADYDAFGWSPLTRTSLPFNESYGLDYESAREATPQWYGVSSGDGNNGVSHTFPDYFVRTCDPWLLARAAVVDMLKEEYQETDIDVDGEAEYTIYAVIYSDPSEVSQTIWRCNHEGCEYESDAEFYDCPDCGEEESAVQDDEEWDNGDGTAWLCLDVFPVTADDMKRSSAREYDTIGVALSERAIEIASRD